MSEADNTILQPIRHTGVGSPTLLVKRKKKLIALVALDRFVTTLGRAPECDIVLDDSGAVSRTHAQILVLDGEVVVEDLNSRNGVLVNRKPIKRHTLRPGDRIAIGEYRLHVLLDQAEGNDRPESQIDIVDLMRRWKGAAVVTQPDGCPLCHASEPAIESPDGPAQTPPADSACDGLVDEPAAGVEPALSPALRRKLRRKLRRRNAPLRV